MVHEAHLPTMCDDVHAYARPNGAYRHKSRRNSIWSVTTSSNQGSR